MIEAIIKGFTLGLLLAISVGPIVFTVIKQSLNSGLKGGFAFIAGIWISDLVLVFTSNVFTEFFIALTAYKNLIGTLGSIFLISVGIFFLFFKKIKLTAEGQQFLLQFRKRDYLRIFIAGMILNFFNPGIIIFWLTTATAFVDHTLNQRIVIFGMALLLALAADVAKVLLADKIRKKLTPRNIHLINRINGLILLVFGVALLWGLIFYNKANG
ncbi:MAG TPA: LysE family transporter [Flavisolibacter sp.]